MTLWGGDIMLMYLLVVGDGRGEGRPHRAASRRGDESLVHLCAPPFLFSCNSEIAGSHIVQYYDELSSNENKN